MQHGLSKETLTALATVLAVLVAALAFALWQESRRDTIEFRFGDGEIEVTRN
ncbi:hypothetical protein [Maricaulis sp. CAU 1757]